MGQRGGRRKAGTEEKGLVAEQAQGPYVLDARRRPRKGKKKKVEVVEEIPDPAEAVARGIAWIDSIAPKLLLRFDPLSIDLQSTEGNPISWVRPLLDGRPSFGNGVRLLCHPREVKAKVSLSLFDQGPSVRPVRPPLPSYRGSDTVTLSRYGFLPHPRQTLLDPYPALNELWRAEIRRRQSSLSS